MRRINLSVSLMLCLTALLSASFSGCAAVTEPERDHRIRVGFSHAEVVNPWRTAQINSFRQAAEGAGYEFLYTEPLEYTQAWQIANVRGMLESGLDFLFLIPIARSGYDEILGLCRETGTSVITLGQPLEGAQEDAGLLSCIYYDYTRAGRLCGEALSEAFPHKSCNIIEIKSSNASMAQEISSGFQTAITSNGSCQIVYSISADGDRIATQKMLEKAIIQLNQSGTGIDAVFAHNDEDGLGALNALKLAGFDLNGIEIVSINGEQDVFKALIAGEYLTTVTCSPMTGAIGCHLIRLALQGCQVPASILIPCLRVDDSNALASYANAY